MVLDKDIYRTAAGLTKIHGADTAQECAELAERWEKRGDEEAAEVWRRILSAVREIEQLGAQTTSNIHAT
jgi:guanylate kinase